MCEWIDRHFVSVIMVTYFNAIPMYVIRWVGSHAERMSDL